MKGYFITESEMELLLKSLELSAMREANVLGQKWNVVGMRPADEDNPTAEDFKYSAYELWRAYNYVVCDWRNNLGR